MKDFSMNLPCRDPTEKPFRNTFKEKIKCCVNVTLTQKAISQRQAELDDTETSDSSTIDSHPESKPFLYSIDIQRREMCSFVIILSLSKVHQVFSFPLCIAYKPRLRWEWTSLTKRSSFLHFNWPEFLCCSSAGWCWTLWWEYFSLPYTWLSFSALFDLQLVLYCAGYSPLKKAP